MQSIKASIEILGVGGGGGLGLPYLLYCWIKGWEDTQ